jgi:hypothetical protein
VAYPEDLVGKYIKLNRTGTALSAQEKSSDDYVLTGHSANMTVPVFNYRTGNPGNPGGRGALPVPPRPAQFVGMAAWNISFLDYFPGKVTAVQLSQYPVLTGPMSGCYLFRYQDQGSTWCSHVGTGETEEVTTQGKRNWKLYAQSQMATDIWGQSPYRFFDDTALGAAADIAEGRRPHIFGLFQPNQTGKEGFYAVLLAPIKSGAPQHGYVKVCAVKGSYLQSWDVIEKTATFKDIRT